MKQSPPFPVLRGERVLLRLPTFDDVPSIVDFIQRNDEHFAPTDPPRPKGFFTQAFWENQILVSREGFETHDSCRFFIFDKDDPHRVIGKANFSQFVGFPFLACYLGYGIDKDEEGKGKMSESLGLAINYVFKEAKIHRIMANYLPTNERSGLLLRRLGFQVEGYARDYLFIKDRWRDHILTSLTNHDLRL